MSFVGDLVSNVFERRYTPWKKSADDPEQTLEELANALVSSSGEGSGIALATRLLDQFNESSDAAKLQFFLYLCTHMDIDPLSVETSLQAYRKQPTAANYSAFLVAVDPKRQELIRRLNRVPGATGRLVIMRTDVLRMKKKHDQLALLDLDFQHLFTSWFNRGFLVMRPITWETPAHVLEKIIAYEAVHAINNWDELRQRLQPSDRRCFAFFHLSMPDEPLIFVEVALTTEVADSIQSVLADGREPIEASDATTAVFYSISNCQVGLTNISFGNFLIKQVARDLAKELPNLSNFVTLSPIPALKKWLGENSIEVNSKDPDEVRDLAMHYLVNAKRDDGWPYDPVSRFHLGNGAVIHAVHANADTSKKGFQQSAGAMVNYRYELDAVASNHERYAQDAFVIANADIHDTAKRMHARHAQSSRSKH